MINKHTAVWGWLMTCPYIQNLYFNFGESGETDTVLVPETAYSDDVVETYINGDSIRNYDFALVRFGYVSGDPNITENAEILVDTELVAEWIEQQNTIRNFPDFGEKCPVREIKILPQNMPIAGIDGNTAKTILQIQIEYCRKK